MPQMAPMNWLTLFITFTFIFLIFNSLNYFTFMKTPNSNNNFNKIKNSLNWKW